ncbi:ABC transporter permease [Aerococcus sanguinicola]|uniref:ABC transporter permease n=2 Tax=Aerococcus TaxID=1375 RepID=UPI0008A306D5|nr:MULTISPECIES: ABC transporter permease [unclassified Aerococcus]KAB0647349.1 ABC transporter permease [Aerococcus sanguinicola]MDK6233187.1 ABC transporter permease [Aerococcus sp. UMB10185]MDK6856024.1 ABC transporter permease [Aerococcus sp. UMB7533]MDK8502381.1 ABC transporter permease [Aerococcus sp. UMB1112A]OFN00297.1 ABC transporter permease [Aerococcus sp. HMSC062A02]
MSKKTLKAPSLYSLIFLVVLIVLWQISANFGWINTFYFSAPNLIVRDLVEMITSGLAWEHTVFTFGISIIGIIIGGLTGMIVAYCLSRFDFMEAVLSPIIVMINGIPKLALGPLFVVWFGIGTYAKIVMSTIMVFFLFFFNAYAGFKNVNQDLIGSLKMMGATRSQIVTKVILPSTLPWLVPSVRTGMGAALQGTIVGEYLGATKGLGWMIQNAGGVFNITRVMSCLFLLMVIMYVIDWLLVSLEKKILVWR